MKPNKNKDHKETRKQPNIQRPWDQNRIKPRTKTKIQTNINKNPEKTNLKKKP